MKFPKSSSLEKLLNLKPDSTIDNELAIRLAINWHKAFCPGHMNWVNEVPKGLLRWDYISSKDYEGDDAREQYKIHKARTYFVMPEDFHSKYTVIYQTDELPMLKFPKHREDFYVFPKNMAWTMAFTHEEGWIGPLFCKHSNYVKLNKKNLQSIDARKYE